MTTIICIGLGTNDPDMLTYAAAKHLQRLTTCATPVPDHAALAHIPMDNIIPLPRYDAHAAVSQLLAYATTCVGEVYCALPGNPNESPIVAELRHRLANNGDGNGDGNNDSTAQPAPHPMGMGMPITMTIIPGVSLLNLIADLLGWTTADDTGTPPKIDQPTIHVSYASQLTNPNPSIPGIPAGPFTKTIDSDLNELAWGELHGKGNYTPPLLPYPLHPSLPGVVWLDMPLTPDSLTKLQTTLLVRYPHNHLLHLLELTNKGEVVQVGNTRLQHLSELGKTSESTPYPSALALDPIHPYANLRSMDGMTLVAARLLAPHGCPWDRQQTFQSLRRELLEETYEVLEALDTNDMATLSEELGDVLFQVVIQSEMGRQAGLFSIEQVLEQISTKLIRRHPHVFADVQVANTTEILHNWEQIKTQELREKGKERTSSLDGVPPALPALAAAQKTLYKAIRAGFAWDTLDDVWGKLHEELDELQAAIVIHERQPSQAHQAHIAAELGDVLFMVVNLANWCHVEAESCMRDALLSFRQRFMLMEQLQHQQGVTLANLSLAEKLALWQTAKHQLRQPT